MGIPATQGRAGATEYRKSEENCARTCTTDCATKQLNQTTKQLIAQPTFENHQKSKDNQKSTLREKSQLAVDIADTKYPTWDTCIRGVWGSWI